MTGNITVKMAAEHLGYKPRYIYELCKHGLISHRRPAHTPRGKITFTIDDLLEYQERHPAGQRQP